MIKYRILPEHKLVVFCFWGSTDVEEVLSLSEALETEPDFSRDFDSLVDDTYLEHTVSGPEMREVAGREIPLMGPASRLAVVAPADLTYGVSRMHQMLTEYRSSLTIEVFRDRAAALEWLGRGGLGLESICEELAKGE